MIEFLVLFLLPGVLLFFAFKKDFASLKWYQKTSLWICYGMTILFLLMPVTFFMVVFGHFSKVPSIISLATGGVMLMSLYGVYALPGLLLLFSFVRSFKKLTTFQCGAIIVTWLATGVYLLFIAFMVYIGIYGSGGM
ncbi:hypothetical protein ACFO26_07755 [Lactococcus nasutitermitis]|uniref:DUF3397 domain-containing protein n=1 Tax=Lactococcus nasutitermitis TaxID=1652957 RepID=A0ABV9JE59_9LACT|nr:hypothetical protein [Lactococcus nasutitermitis]